MSVRASCAQVILSHAKQLYLDNPYEHDTKEPGLFWATDYVDTRKAFNYHLPPSTTTAASETTQQQQQPQLMAPSLLRRLCHLYGELKGCPSLQQPNNVVGKSLSPLSLPTPVLATICRNLGPKVWTRMTSATWCLILS